jgi:lipid-binding SYLF domain-containing protein
MTRRIVLAGALLIALAGCRGPEGGTVGEKRQYIRDFTAETIGMLSAANPQIKEELDKASAYAVFSSMNTFLFTFSSTNGYGMGVNKATGDEVWMKVFGLGVGLGGGLKIYRELMIFETEAAAKQFFQSGWEASGKAEGVGKVGDTNVADTSIQEEAIPGVKVYATTDTGVMGQASVHGKKYYLFTELMDKKDEDAYDAENADPKG